MEPPPLLPPRSSVCSAPGAQPTISRRGFLGALVAAPAIILTPGLLMRVRPVLLGKLEPFEYIARRAVGWNVYRNGIMVGFVPKLRDADGKGGSGEGFRNWQFGDSVAVMPTEKGSIIHVEWKP